MSTHVQIADRALARIGCQPVISFDIISARVQNVKRIYDQVLEDVMSKGRWHCARRIGSLTRITEEPSRYWKFRYKLPPDRIGLPEGYWDSKDRKRPLTLFELSDDEIWTDAELVFAAYPIVPSPVNWPGYLREVVQLALMAEYALAMREDAAMRKALRSDLYGNEQYQGEGGQFGVAMALEAQSHAREEIDGGRNPVHDARFQGGDARQGLEGFSF